jgi:hypothetical protein
LDRRRRRGIGELLLLLLGRRARIGRVLDLGCETQWVKF